MHPNILQNFRLLVAKFLVTKDTIFVAKACHWWKKSSQFCCCYLVAYRAHQQRNPKSVTKYKFSHEIWISLLKIISLATKNSVPELLFFSTLEYYFVSKSCEYKSWKLLWLRKVVTKTLLEPSLVTKNFDSYDYTTWPTFNPCMYKLLNWSQIVVQNTNMFTLPMLKFNS